MRQYEITFIVDPVLSGDEVKSTAQTYVKWLENEGATIVNFDEMGLRQLAYTINRRSSGVYFCIEIQAANGNFLTKFELALQRDERIMRYLTVALDKFGVKYNQDKRDGKIGKVAPKKAKNERTEAPVAKQQEAPAPAPVVEAPAAPVVETPAPVVVEAPVVEAPAVEEAVAPVVNEVVETAANVEETVETTVSEVSEPTDEA